MTCALTRGLHIKRTMAGRWLWLTSRRKRSVSSPPRPCRYAVWGGGIPSAQPISVAQRFKRSISTWGLGRMARRRQAANQDSGCAAIAVVGVLALLISKCAGPSENEGSLIEPDQVAVTTQYAASPRGVNCRSSPSQSSAKVAAFGNGEALSVAAQKDGWVKIVRSGDDCWVASRLLSSFPPVTISEPARLYEEPRSYSRSRQSSASFSCGAKRTCGEMDSCAEANHYLNVCGRSRLDGDGDGVPCESIC